MKPSHRTFEFWKRPFRNWRFWIVPACFLLEMPFLACMSDPGEAGYRRIHGINALHVFMSEMTGVSTFHNVIGWLFDFDKIVAYVVTCIAFVALSRSTLKYLEWRRAVSQHLLEHHLPDPDGLDRLPSAETSPWMPSVTLGAFAGAVLITVHYAISGSQHYCGNMDKGLFSAIHHLQAGAFDIGWFSLMCYRLSYLILAPVIYFVLFATTSTALMLIWRMSKVMRSVRHLQTQENMTPAQAACLGAIDVDGRTVVRSLLTVVVLPAGMLFLLHHLISWSLGLGQYGADWRTGRFWILIILYGQAAIAMIVGGFYEFFKTRAAILAEFRQHPTTALIGWLVPIILWLCPTLSPALDIRKSNYNAALNLVADWGDASVPTTGKSRVCELESVIERFVHGAWFPKADCIEFHRDKIDDRDYRAFLTLAGGLLVAGENPGVVSKVVEHWRQTRTIECASSQCSDVYLLLSKLFHDKQWERGLYWKKGADCAAGDELATVLGELADALRAPQPGLKAVAQQ